jgi:flagellar biosynthesis GTPase FlhF
MIVKTFTGPSLRDALQRVRDSFGADAVILDTKFGNGTRNRFSGDTEHVSVTAAVEPETDAEVSPQPAPVLGEGPKTLHVRGDLAAPAPEPADTSAELPDAEPVVPEATAGAPADNGQFDRVVATLSELTSTLQTKQAGTNLWPAVQHWLAGQSELIAGLAESFATDVTESLPPIEPFLSIRSKGQNVLFVGGRGAGKSTAMFKAFAARWKSTDRIPQVTIIGTDLDHGQDRLIATCQRCDVQVETAVFQDGRLRGGDAPKKGDGFAEFVDNPSLANLESHARVIRRRFRPHAVVLVLSATGTPVSWHAACERYSVFNPTHLLFTRWDESQPWWEVAIFARQRTLLLSYLTSGIEPFGQIDPFTASAVRTGITDDVTRTIAGKEVQ